MSFGEKGSSSEAVPYPATLEDTFDHICTVSPSVVILVKFHSFALSRHIHRFFRVLFSVITPNSIAITFKTNLSVITLASRVITQDEIDDVVRSI